MKTKEEILDNKFEERGIRKGWIDESKQAVLDAMDEYLDEFVVFYEKKMEENSLMCGIGDEILSEFRNDI